MDVRTSMGEDELSDGEGSGPPSRPDRRNCPGPGCLGPLGCHCDTDAGPTGGSAAGARAVLLGLAVDVAIRVCGGWPVPAADPFAVLQRAFALGVTDADYDEALEALQARLAIRGYPRYIPPLRWTAP